MVQSYESARRQLEEAWAGDPDNERLIWAQIHYCAQLGWPEDCSAVLFAAKRHHGMTEELTGYFVAFYRANKRHKGLLDLLRNEKENRDLVELKIEAMAELGLTKEASQVVNEYARQHHDPRALEFTARQYLTMQDSALAALWYHRLFRLDAANPELKNYYPMLLEWNRFEKAHEVITTLIKSDPDDQLRLDECVALYGLNQGAQAKQQLRKLRHLPEAYYLFGTWFLQEKRLDSAAVYLTRYTTMVPQRPEGYAQLGHTLEAATHYSKSLVAFEQAYALDTTDQKLAAHIQLVRQKIAYLQTQKKRAQRPPPPELERKTLLENK
jgi:predicted Zn-dependent protease